MTYAEHNQKSDDLTTNGSAQYIYSPPPNNDRSGFYERQLAG